MGQIIINVPDECLSQADLSPQAMAAEMKMAAAARLYAQERMSMHQAAVFSGLDEFSFRSRLGDYGVSVFTYGPDELAAELR